MDNPQKDIYLIDNQVEILSVSNEINQQAVGDKNG